MTAKLMESWLGLRPRVKQVESKHWAGLDNMSTSPAQLGVKKPLLVFPEKLKMTVFCL